MKEIVVILGYGCELNEDIKRYLKEVASYIKSHNVRQVIVSGGFTQKETKPDISEAMIMKYYLEKLNIYHKIIQKEERSESTIEKLEYTSFIINANSLFKKDDCKAVVFCDSIRRYKVKAEADHFYDFPFEVRGVDLNRSLGKKLYQYLIATPLELLFFKSSFLREVFHFYRKEKNKFR